MRIFLTHAFSAPLLYHLSRAETIKAPYFEILHIFNTQPYKSIVGIMYNENHKYSPNIPPRFEATHYLTNQHTQHPVHHSSLKTFNYIHVDEPHLAHFILPSDIKPKDRLLLI